MKHNEERERMKIVANIFEHANKEKRKCVVDGCGQDSINSHLLQRHGILDNITEENHLVEIRPKDIFAFKEKDYPIQFKKMGINQAISRPIFCNRHDTELFQEIETANPDFMRYKSQLLLTYRSICCELRMKEIQLDKYQRMARANTLSDCREFNQNLADSTLEGIRDIKLYKQLIEKELLKPQSSFTFKTYQYNFKGLCASTSFNLLDKHQLEYGDNTLDCVFCHVVPQANHTTIIVGYENNHTNSLIREYVDSWSGLELEELGIKLTDLILRCELWSMAPSWYDKISKEKQETYKMILCHYFKSPLTTMPEITFNMFENCL